MTEPIQSQPSRPRRGHEVDTSQPLKVLQLGKAWFTSRSGGGLDRAFTGLLSNFHHVNVDAEGLVVGDESDGRNSRIRGVARNDQPVIQRLWGFRRAVKQTLERSSYDLVASHFALYASSVLDLVDPYPHVIHFHGPWADESRSEGASSWNVRAKEAVERRVYGRGDRFIVLSEAFAEILASTYQIPEARIRIVPGGVEVSRFDTRISQEEARERLQWPIDRPIILTVRRLARRMGIENLIEAMTEVRENVPEALLLIAGQGPLEASLREQIEASNLEENVRLLGFVADEDLPLAYRASDVSVVPSVELEGFGLVTIESLAAGTPVVVTPVGGLPETVERLSDELVLPNTAPATIADALSQIVLGRMTIPDGEACRNYAREYFDWPVIASKVRDVYEEVL